MRRSNSFKLVLGALCAGVLLSGTGQAQAGTVTYDWFNFSPQGPDAFGTLTLASALLTGPSDPREPYSYNLTPAEIAAAGETILGDLTSFTFSYGGHTLTKADITATPPGWTAQDNAMTNGLSASHTFSDGTLLVETLAGNTFGSATFGSQSVAGEWLITSVTPVPLPGAAWLLLSGAAALGWFTFRFSGASSRPRRYSTGCCFE